ncbi:MAG TPA: winged helix-turn-helix domain-containing protein, partial [Terriglobales bacterium]
MQKTEPGCLRRFGVFELDPRAGELTSKGSRVKLQDQPLQILLALLEKPGQIVTREELRAKLWPADTFVDFDHGLNAAVKRLRDALGDTAENPRYIETLPRHGYRFIAAAVPDALPPERSDTLLKQSGWLLGVAAVLLIVGVLFAVDAGGVRGKLLFRSATPPQIRSLAVLPLANLSGDPQQEYFSDGMTDELIGELSRISSLRVISRTSVLQYQGEKKKPIPQIGRELNVDAVMEGTVLRSGNRVRIAAQLIYAPTDQHLMGETYESDLGDVLKLQREVAEAVAERVRARLTPEQQARFRETPKVDPEAYQAYLMATYRDLAVDQENRTARSYVQRAIQKDPNFSLAHSLLAFTYVVDGEMRRQSPQEVYPLAKQAAHKALE